MNEQNQASKERKKASFNLNGVINIIVKALPIVAIVFFAFAIIGFAFNGLDGIIDAIRGKSFWIFVDAVKGAFASLAQYLFYGVVCASFAKIFKR